MLVAEHLHLDVARAHEQLLQVERGVSERGLGLARRLREHVGELVGLVRGPDPAAASAAPPPSPSPGSRARRRRERLVERGVPSVPGTVGTPASRASVRAAALSPICSITAAVGPTNAMPALLARGGEVGVLGEEAVAGMDRVGARLLRRLEQSAGRSGSCRGRAAGRCTRPRRPAGRAAPPRPPSSRRRRSRARARGRQRMTRARSLRGSRREPCALRRNAQSVSAMMSWPASTRSSFSTRKRSTTPFLLARDLVEVLHDLDEPDDVSRPATRSPFGDVGVGLGSRPPVEGARKGGLDRLVGHWWFLALSASSRLVRV